MPKTNKTVEERFLQKIHKDANGCWNWVGAKLRGGYGSFVGENKYHWQAHRFSYCFYVGSLPTNLDVLHKCDNPSCVNPDHLFLGTDKDNVNDRIKKGRNPKGEKISILSEKDVLSIRKYLKLKIPRKVIAKKFNVGQTCITDIYSGRTWSWLEEK